MTDESGSLSQSLNQACFCITLDRAALLEAIARETNDPGFSSKYVETRPHLFSHAPVFVSAADAAEMMGVVKAIEAATRLPLYRDAVLEWAPEIARRDFGPHGVFMGYDFHLGTGAPRLIEVNTNAGGAFLNAMLAKAQRACCAEVDAAFAKPPADDFEAKVLSMFKREWSAQGRPGHPETIAIVDDHPTEQYLYPEFVIAQRLLEKGGFQALVADGASLAYESGRLTAGGRAIDLVYNRLVDFSLQQPEHAALRAAYLDGAVVLTPNPGNHALFADKRNFVLLSDARRMQDIGLPSESVARLSSVPRTVRVTADASTQLWEDRKRLFFKPATGHGGKAVYRGDKITKRVWAEILAGDFIAQDLAPPSERVIRIDGAEQSRKLDVRLYTYDGELLLAAARLYQGQTTNFRTPGGGFAPVYVV
jgi:hypothetical protein